ncbi:PAS domain-containing sensor histidine kinase [Antarcticimicrobium sediminis]|nr:PAS domain-containing sensor histidine kinase [Antarcticimicrobium sediminis]
MAGGKVHPDLVALFPTVVQRSAGDGVGAGESFLAHALDQHALVSVANTDEKILYVNDRFAQISGYSKAELVGQTHRILRSAEQPASLYEDLWAKITNGETWYGEVKQIRKNGDPYWVKATVVPFFSPDGRPEKFLSIHTDITESKRAEAQLQRQLSFDLIKDEIYLFWPDTLEVFYLNQSARIRLRIRRGSKISLTPAKLLHGVTKRDFRSHLQPLLAGGSKWITFEAEHKQPDGQIAPAEVTIQLIRPHGEEPRFLAHVRNISKRKQAEITKRQFISNISHELRTPLTAIRGAFGLIKTGLALNGAKQAVQLSEMGLKNTARLEALIENLLDMERIAAGRMMSKMGRVVLDEVITGAISGVADYKSSKQVRVVFVAQGDPVCVKGDAIGLSRVFGILLSNAIKFSHDGGRVEIRVRRDGARIAVSVCDYGIGIPEHFKPDIFTPFTQADTSDTRRSDGAGIGLVIAQSIVEEHGGSIKVHSTEGEGTEVSFFLIPCAEEAQILSSEAIG